MLLIFRRFQLRRSYKPLAYFFYVLFVITVILFLITNQVDQDYTSETVFRLRRKLDIEMACHYQKGEDVLPIVDKDVKFSTNSIFFIEYSCNGLNSRQACSVESASRANPNREVNVLFLSTISWDEFKNNVISKLLFIPNFDAMRIYIEDYTEGTPLHIKMKNKMTREELRMDLADILKFVTIYKYPGTYLSMDVIVVNSFSDLEANWVVKETPASISSNIFCFSDDKIGRELVNIGMHILLSDVTLPSQNLWSFNNLAVTKKLMQLWCGTSDMLEITSIQCHGPQVIEPQHFYPISFYQRHKYFGPYYRNTSKGIKIYAYQIWERFTRYNIVTNSSLFTKLAKQNCPITYKFYGDDFGLM